MLCKYAPPACKMGGIYSVYWEMRKAYTFLFRKSGEKLLWRSRHWCEDKIKVNLKKRDLRMWNVFIWFRFGTVACSYGHSDTDTFFILPDFMWLYSHQYFGIMNEHMRSLVHVTVGTKLNLKVENCLYNCHCKSWESFKVFLHSCDCFMYVNTCFTSKAGSAERKGNMYISSFQIWNILWTILSILEWITLFQGGFIMQILLLDMSSQTS
jgi:hypothetical protein